MKLIPTPQQPPTDSSASAEATGLSTFDAASLIVGIVIGVTIFKMPGIIAAETTSAWQLLGLWALGGFLALLGAFCYAELGATYGGAGGDYCYQTRAFGPWAGFLFGWTQFVVVQTINIAMFAIVFAESAWHVAAPSREPTLIEVHLAAAATVALLSAINFVGLRSGKWTQNLLSAAKLLGISLLLIAGMSVDVPPPADAAIKTSGEWTVALILILYAYGGWNDAAYVVTEVRDRQRNLPRALIVGVGLVTAVYLAVNAIYWKSLGFAGLQTTGAPPVALMTAWFGPSGGRLMSAIVMVSSLGAVNGLILAVSRLHAAVGSDHRLFALLGRWSAKHSAPVGALVVQAVFTILLLMLVGTPAGRELLDNIFSQLTGKTLPWGDNLSTFNLLFAIGAPVFWAFFLLTGLAFFMLRFREPDALRPYRVPFYPLPPILFLAMCVFGIWASASYAGSFTWLGIAPVVVGALIYVVERILFGRRGSPA